MSQRDPYAHGVKCKKCGQVCRLLRGEERKNNGGFCFYFDAEPRDYLWGPKKQRLCDECKAKWRESQRPPPAEPPSERPAPANFKPDNSRAADQDASSDQALARLLSRISDAALLAELQRRGLKP